MTSEPTLELHRYNLLFVEQESPGLHIVTTPSYISLVQQNPGLLHQNYGDFYSEVAHEDLADRVYRLLQKANVAEDTRIVPAGSFDEKILDPSKEYIITETAGIRLYAPHLHQEEDPSLGPEAAYFFLSLYFLEDLFYAKKEGVLQKQFKEKTRELKELLDISSELTKVTAEMRSLARELKRGFSGNN